MKIVIACDSFKESLSAEQACQAVKKGWSEIFPNAHYVLVPMADGGEGTVAALVAACDGEWVELTVSDPLGRPILARYGMLPDGVAVIEMAQAAGLHLLAENERNPFITTTFGVGEMMKDALKKGVKKIILGLGGSATNDGGTGMARALGVRFLDENGVELPDGGLALKNLKIIDFSNKLAELNDCEIIGACDVKNPLYGEKGASFVFAPQKGATPDMVVELDNSLKHYSNIVSMYLEDFSQHEGSGAAGGMGFGLRALLGGKLQSGVEMVLNVVKMPEKIHGADLVITGEGRMDGQTAWGKVPFGVLQVANCQNIPVIGIAGSIGQDVENLYQYGFKAIFPSVPRAASLAEILAEAEFNLRFTARQIASVYQFCQLQNK